MRLFGVVFVCIFLFVKINFGQNLIKNSSFTEVYHKIDTNTFYRILPKNSSSVKFWYIPDFLVGKKKDSVNAFEYSQVFYYSSHDKALFLKNKYFTNSDQYFDNNIGFIRLFIRPNINTLIQQEFDKPLVNGNYCLKFKYRFLKYNSSRRVPLEFYFSNNSNKQSSVRNINYETSVKVTFIDTLSNCDENCPWQQVAIPIKLLGGENYITIGSIAKKVKQENYFGAYHIDDIELVKIDLANECKNTLVNKDLKGEYLKEFPLGVEISNDTLIMYTPLNNWSPTLIAPATKLYLNEIISFMQRNKNIKIKLIEYYKEPKLNAPTVFTGPFTRYLMFYSIDASRIATIRGKCVDQSIKYCGTNSEYIKIGFVFYKD